METKTIEDKSFQVKEGRTIISVPHLEDKVSFDILHLEELMEMLQMK